MHLKEDSNKDDSAETDVHLRPYLRHFKQGVFAFHNEAYLCHTRQRDEEADACRDGGLQAVRNQFEEYDSEGLGADDAEQHARPDGRDATLVHPQAVRLQVRPHEDADGHDGRYNKGQVRYEGRYSIAKRHH
jgi:hypothetical protein